MSVAKKKKEFFQTIEFSLSFGILYYFFFKYRKFHHIANSYIQFACLLFRNLFSFLSKRLIMYKAFVIRNKRDRESELCKMENVYRENLHENLCKMVASMIQRENI